MNSVYKNQELREWLAEFSRIWDLDIATIQIYVMESFSLLFSDPVLFTIKMLESHFYLRLSSYLFNLKLIVLNYHSINISKIGKIF